MYILHKVFKLLILRCLCVSKKQFKFLINKNKKLKISFERDNEIDARRANA